jgi:hypothetical protein
MTVHLGDEVLQYERALGSVVSAMLQNRTNLALAAVMGALAARCSGGTTSRAPDASPDAIEPLPDAAADAEPDAPPPDLNPCGVVRPFACVDTCCAEECGSAVNDCSPTPDPTLAIEAPGPDAGVDACIDEFLTHDDCLGCGVACDDTRPFCCGATCCRDECGQVGNDCAP